jgi:hypothetical protein
MRPRRAFSLVNWRRIRDSTREGVNPTRFQPGDGCSVLFVHARDKPLHFRTGPLRTAPNNGELRQFLAKANAGFAAPVACQRRSNFDPLSPVEY